MLPKFIFKAQFRVLYLRAFIALIVIAITWFLAVEDDISSAWEAVFVVVIGYYFKDRVAEEFVLQAEEPTESQAEEPTESQAEEPTESQAEEPTESQAEEPTESQTEDSARLEKTEMWLQFLLAMLMVINTAAAFIIVKEEISGVWVGAVVLAVAFYFKEVRGYNAALQNNHLIFRALIAATVSLLTVPIVILLSRSDADTILPISWVGIVFVVVAFYFKDGYRESQPGSGEGNYLVR